MSREARDEPDTGSSFAHTLQHPQDIAGELRLRGQWRGSSPCTSIGVVLPQIDAGIPVKPVVPAGGVFVGDGAGRGEDASHVGVTLVFRAVR